MQLMHFHTLRSGVQVNASPATVPVRQGMAAALRAQLVASGLFDTVEVEHTDDPDQLVIGLCEFRPLLSEDHVAAWIDKIWDEQVSYPFWEAHWTRVDPGHVEFEGATRESITGRYVTVHLVAQRSPVPAQRAPIA